MNSTIKFKENDVKELIKLLMLDNAELVKIKEEAELATTKKKSRNVPSKEEVLTPTKKTLADAPRKAALQTANADTTTKDITATADKEKKGTGGGKNSRRAASIAYSLKKRSERKKKAKKATIKSR